MIEPKESPKNFAEFGKREHTIETKDAIACGRQTWNGYASHRLNRRLAEITTRIVFGAVAVVIVF
jgi:hypothetical protein